MAPLSAGRDERDTPKAYTVAARYRKSISDDIPTPLPVRI